MIIPGLSKYLIIGGVVTLALSNAITGCAVHRYVTAQWDAERTQAANDALREKARMEAQYRAVEAMQQEATRNLEAEYARRIADHDLGRTEFERRLTERLRAQTDRVRQCELSRAAADSERPEDPATGSSDVVGSINLGAVQRVRDAGLKMQETLRLCHEWATSVGR